MRFLITYDLIRPVQQYDKLITELKRLGAKRVLASTWLYTSNSTAYDICAHLLKCGGLDGNDKLLVAKASDPAWTSNLSPAVQPYF